MPWYHRWSLSRYRTAGLLLVILLLVSLHAHIGAQSPLRQPAASLTVGTPSPTCDPTATTDTSSPSPDLTATIEETPNSACDPSATAGTPSPTIDPSQLTPSISAAALITSTTPIETPTSSPSAPSVVTPSLPATPLPTTTPAPLQTPTAIPTPSDGVMCPPGAEIVFTGEAPPRTALLLAFEQRIVGGGSADAGGRFRIPLAVGNERPGYYVVKVQVRGTKQVLRQWTCIVPEFTPTPTPSEFIPTATPAS
ncbi:MAG TPA: hypothetical protein VFO07_01925 [Roseiflexaceae bacterium]|nr:hypothetical protein [Roseiflexaceae bacterium]